MYIFSRVIHKFHQIGTRDLLGTFAAQKGALPLRQQVMLGEVPVLPYGARQNEIWCLKETEKSLGVNVMLVNDIIKMISNGAGEVRWRGFQMVSNDGNIGDHLCCYVLGTSSLPRIWCDVCTYRFDRKPTPLLTLTSHRQTGRPR
jgi:hypothetical protein